MKKSFNKKATRDLLQAVELHDTSEISALIARGADINAKGEDGRTALHMAAEDRSDDLVEALLQNGADPNALSSPEGQTPLHVAASKSDTGIVQLLLNHGATPDILDRTGRNPLHIAAWEGDWEIFDALVEAGGDVTVKDAMGRTPRTIATKRLDGAFPYARSGYENILATAQGREDAIEKKRADEQAERDQTAAAEQKLQELRAQRNDKLSLKPKPPGKNT